jgi:hypothetical protein
LKTKSSEPALRAKPASPQRPSPTSATAANAIPTEIDLTIYDDGERTVLYIPSKCHISLVEPDFDGRRKLQEFQQDSGARIVVVNGHAVSSGANTSIAKVTINGNQDQRNVASSKYFYVPESFNI